VVRRHEVQISPNQTRRILPWETGALKEERTAWKSVLGNWGGDSVAKKRQAHGEDSLAEETCNQGPEKSHVSFLMSLHLLCANPHDEAPRELQSGALCVSSALHLPYCRDMQLPSNMCRDVEVTGHSRDPKMQYRWVG
jgi:hypothetical protein